MHNFNTQYYNIYYIQLLVYVDTNLNIPDNPVYLEYDNADLFSICFSISDMPDNPHYYTEHCTGSGSKYSVIPLVLVLYKLGMLLYGVSISIKVI